MKKEMLGDLGRNNIKSFQKVVIGNLHRLGTTIRRISPIETLGDDSILGVRDDSKKYNSHSKLDLESHRFFDNSGFTLIELLVVVLIIGILSAVAVPQYQKAVEKSRATQGLAMLRSVGQAAISFRLATGDFPESFDELPIDIPWTGTQKWYNVSAADYGVIDTLSNQDWSVQLYHTSQDGFLATVGRLSGKYKGAGFVMSATGAHKINCAERKTSGVIFTEPEGSYCEKLFKATRQTSCCETYRSYLLP